MNYLGRYAEMNAANYLRDNGYYLVAHSYKSRFGEIDLIARNDKYIAFVEVKARNENSIATPREFVDDKKQKKIIATSSIFLSRHKTDLQPRFDVIEVYMQDNKIKSIKHLENAFTL